MAAQTQKKGGAPWGLGARRVQAPEEWGPKFGGGGLKGGRPNISRFFFLFPIQISPFFALSGVFSWNCGHGSRPWTTQIVRLGFFRVILCEPRRPTGRVKEKKSAKFWAVRRRGVRRRGVRGRLSGGGGSGGGGSGAGSRGGGSGGGGGQAEGGLGQGGSGGGGPAEGGSCGRRPGGHTHTRTKHTTHAHTTQHTHTTHTTHTHLKNN